MHRRTLAPRQIDSCPCTVTRSQREDIDPCVFVDLEPVQEGSRTHRSPGMRRLLVYYIQLFGALGVYGKGVLYSVVMNGQIRMIAFGTGI